MQILQVYSSMRLRFIVTLALLLSFGISSTPQKSRKKEKSTDGGQRCPDTCALKRRIGKVEIRTERGISESKSYCADEITNLRQQINESNGYSSDSRPNQRNEIPGLKRGILQAVDEKLKASSKEIKVQVQEQYDALKHTLSRITSNQESESESESTQRVVAAMNQTIHALQRQNQILLRQTQEIRAHTSVLRAQNEALNEDISFLRRNDREKKAMSVDQDRIIDIEDRVNEHVTKISSLQSKLEWISSRIDRLSDITDSAQAQASGASDKANRAAEVARQAISLARRRSSGSTGDEKEVEDPTELRQPDIPPNDCWELYNMGYNVSGVYRIRPWRSPQTFEVYCDQSYSGGGWTVIQRRRDGSVNFHRNWNAYADGFGNPTGEMWIGNEKLFYLTNQDDCTLQVLLLDWEGHRAFAEYESFRIQGNSDNYAVEIGRFVRGNAGDGLRGTLRDGSRNAHLATFTTRDIDNDHCRPCIADSNGGTFENCANLQGGGWWFRACSDSNLNGRYILPQDFSSCGEACQGIQWRTWRSEPNYSLKASIMLLRRNVRRAENN